MNRRQRASSGSNGSFVLSGWGRTTQSHTRRLHRTFDDLATVLADPPAGGLIVRGAGRSYGDPALNTGGTVIELDDSVDAVVVDRAAHTATVPGGVRLGELARRLLPLGYALRVTPGTAFVTAGGAFASDVHGKNHRHVGSFATNVRSVDLLLADATAVTVAPDRDPELFWATAGGMGLTGVIGSVTVDLTAVETSSCVVETRRVGSLDALAELLGDDRMHHSVAWVDAGATGRSLGRGVWWGADDARLEELGAADRRDPLADRSRRLTPVPQIAPGRGFVRPSTSALYRTLRYATTRTGRRVVPRSALHHPLDRIGEWHRLYGRPGVVQYQFAVPGDRLDVVRTVLERVSASGLAGPLAVLKRLGAADPAPLGFAMAGWTLAIDFANVPSLAALLDDLDVAVLEGSGRHYLAKDSRAPAGVVHAGYPRLAEWLAVKARVDPDGVFRSDLGRRLGLCPDVG